MEFGPDALLGLKLQSSIMTPETDMVIFGYCNRNYSYYSE